jgi:unsaturated chondroitin disaccharide hydrolase
MTAPAKDQEALEDAMGLIVDGTRSYVSRLMKDYDGYIGHISHWTGRYARSDHYAMHDVGWLLGRLWVCFVHTGDQEFRDLALRILKPMLPNLTEQPIGSMGSGCEMFFGLCLGAEITGSPELHDLAVKASRNYVKSLWSERLGRFEPWQGYDEHEVPVEWGGLLYHLVWTSHAVPEHVDYFARHMESILTAGLVRPDGSTAHIAYVDENGRPERFATMQGWRPESTWARGQSWAMHSFIAAAQASGRSSLKEASRRIVRYWLDHVRPDWVPFYDFDDPDHEALPRDSCAAAMGASALMRYASEAGDLSARLSEVVDGTLAELSRNYVSVGGILIHCSFGRIVKLYGMEGDQSPPGYGQPGKCPARFPQEEIMPYGSYFIAEGLHKRLKGDAAFPSLRAGSRFR